MPTILVPGSHGTYEVAAGGYECQDGCSVRLDRYVPADGSKPIMERRFCAGHGDVSAPRHTEDAHNYDARCTWCYLGARHTEDAHVQIRGA